jgi:hypothetical protein
MKTQILLSSLAILIASLFLGCYKEEDSSSGGDSQNVLIWADFDSTYQNLQGNTIFTPNVEIGGVVMADPLPTLEYWKVGDISFTSSAYWSYGPPGYLAFGNMGGDDEPYIPPITTNLNPLTVEVKTSMGTLIGIVSLPTALTGLYSNFNDTLPLNQSLTVSWTDIGADYYGYYLDYWRSNMDDIEIDDITLNNSVTFNSSYFTADGEVWINVWPYNGPIPQAGAVPNMVGDGNGFLCYEGFGDQIYLIVGDGFGSYKNNNPSMSESSMRSNRFENLCTAYGFNLE